MPSDSTDYASEPQFTSTHCACPRSKYDMHETDCISRKPEPEKLSPYAGKRAWKKLRKEASHA